MYHLSNFFFRDVQYGIRMMLEEKGMKIGYTESEKAAREFVQQLERSGIFVPIDQQSWAVRYPEFKTPPVVKPAAAAKPAGPAPAVPRQPSADRPPSAAATAQSSGTPQGSAPAIHENRG